MIKDFLHVVLVILFLIGLYIVFNSPNAQPLVKTGFVGSTGLAKVLQGR